ncbi:MAG: hypothetical protein E7256_08200 [Lachnospiraceae bacterium]|nr:hypothetical protein [Lachnospiraceae bacterium]
MNNCLSIEIVCVEVRNKYAYNYKTFEYALTRQLNQMFPEYHLGADVYEDTCNPNCFYVVAIYNPNVPNSTRIYQEMSDYVERAYKKRFPHVVSRKIITNASESKRVFSCFHTSPYA